MTAVQELVLEKPSIHQPGLPHDFYRDLVSGRRAGIHAKLLRSGLGLVSVGYGLGIRARNWLFDHGWKRSYPAAVPVVSIGNLTLGGTGKTPAVEYVARYYRELGLRPAILSRGYGSASGQNDEALVLENNLPDVPHLQGPDRVALARLAVEKFASEVLVLDDGLQHRRLRRDLDIVLIDATEPWGYGRLFPRGLLRESPQGLRRADLILLTRCDQVSAQKLEHVRAETHRWAPDISVAESVHAPMKIVTMAGGHRPTQELEDKPVAAFCGIGNPSAFYRTLANLGCHVTAFEVFSDHHNYSRQDMDRLERWARRQPAGGVMVTTQKDLVKLRLATLGGRPLWAVQIALRVTAGQDALDHKLKGVFR